MAFHREVFEAPRVKLLLLSVVVFLTIHGRETMCLLFAGSDRR